MYHWNVYIQRMEASRTLTELLYKKAGVRKITSKESRIKAIRTYQNPAPNNTTELWTAGNGSRTQNKPCCMYQSEESLQVNGYTC
jgi:hypothetical protein